LHSRPSVWAYRSPAVRMLTLRAPGHHRPARRFRGRELDNDARIWESIKSPTGCRSIMQPSALHDHGCSTHGMRQVRAPIEPRPRKSSASSQPHGEVNRSVSIPGADQRRRGRHARCRAAGYRSCGPHLISRRAADGPLRRTDHFAPASWVFSAAGLRKSQRSPPRSRFALMRAQRSHASRIAGEPATAAVCAPWVGQVSRSASDRRDLAEAWVPSGLFPRRCMVGAGGQWAMYPGDA